MVWPGRHRFILCGGLIVVLAAPVWAQKTIHVPGDATTIQAGINAASEGDTVLVAPGTYVENIDFMGKAITVTSSGGPEVTTIDGGQKGIVVRFANSETRVSVINGFTITNDAPPLPEQVTFWTDGVFVGQSNPTITNNIITNNRGYGIEVSFGSAYISGNTISHTDTANDPRFDYGCDYDDGAGIHIGGTSNGITDPPVIDHNTIEQNLGYCLGGGIALYAAPLSTIISNNIIAHNQSLGFGGGVFEVNGSVSLHQNLIYDNVAGVAGGGAYLAMGSENGATGPLNVFLTNNTIYGNTIVVNPKILASWIDGSQVALPGYVSQLGFFNNLIIANDAYAAIACWPTYQYLSGAPPVVVSNDVRNVRGPAYGGWCTSPAGNTGNISADPKFKNPPGGDFHLLAGSPAIDTGFNAAPGSLATDIESAQRIQNATGATEPLVDMGAYESTGAPESRPASHTALTVQPETVFYGQPVTLSATVTDSSGSPILEGTVNFMDDWSTVQQSLLNDSGIATVSTSAFDVGPHWLVASFGGNASNQPGISTTAKVSINGFSTSTTITFSPNPGHYGKPETLTAAVVLAPGNPPGTPTPTGNIAFIVSGSLLATVPLNPSGVAMYTTSSLPVGTSYIQAIYKPTGGFLSSWSQNLSLQIVANPVATVAIWNVGSIATIQPLDVTISVTGTFGNPTPTGSVTLTSGAYSSVATTLNAGSVMITVPAGALGVGQDTLTVQYSGDSTYGAATGTGSVVVTLPIAISGTSVSVSAGATSGNQSTITVSPAGGFQGAVTLTASVTTSPHGGTHPPTFSFGTTGTVDITSDAPGTATLTIATVAPVGCSQASEARSFRQSPVSSRLALGCIVLLLALRMRPRRGQLPMLLLLLGLISATTGCGGSGGGGGGCSDQSSGTTRGNYVITITGTSGSVVATGRVTLTVR